MVVRSSSISFPPEHTHTEFVTWSTDIIMLRQKCLLKQIWTDSEFWSVRYANPATSRVPKKPPITQPMRMEKLVPLSTCESQRRVLNRSSNALFIYHQHQLQVKPVRPESLPWTCRTAEDASVLFDAWQVTLVPLSEKEVPLRVHVAISSPFFTSQLP